MSYIFWNCRGLGSDTMVQALHKLIRKFRPSMIFLSETKMQDHRIDGVQRRMGFPCGFNVSPIGKSGGLSLWWDANLEVEICLSSKNVIDARVRSVGEVCWMQVTGVYGTAYRMEKAGFLEWLTSHLRPSTILWLYVGDFNEILMSLFRIRRSLEDQLSCI